MCATGADLSKNFPAFFPLIAIFYSDNSKIMRMIKEGEMPVSTSIILRDSSHTTAFIVGHTVPSPSLPLRRKLPITFLRIFSFG
jgi:hypothetical protein